ncbi:hypothetical protein [Methylocystis sp. B8]|uniref:hypothetical protein n=1 Tax=Methylocystis sp. B8 TaxID=544938 RepID=UPI0010FE40E6|nr:hypothetical protein [Methylocystis sp. B8]TLG78633.1 hypothetical protein FEV16_00900 [Methylocystis sp. B8]
MAEATYTKLDIAHEYLDTAMQLYIEKRSYFSAIHLAGAAEELFGRHLPKDERISTIALKAQIGFQVLESGKEVEYETAQKTERKKALGITLGSKNSVKHMNDDGSDSTVTIDPVVEARNWIEDALINLEKLNLPKPKNYMKFVSCRNLEAEH